MSDSTEEWHLQPSSIEYIEYASYEATDVYTRWFILHGFTDEQTAQHITIPMTEAAPKQFINDASNVIDEMLEGLIESNPHLCW